LSLDVDLTPLDPKTPLVDVVAIVSLEEHNVA